MSDLDPLGERLRRMAVSQAKVTDHRSVAGIVRVDVDHAAYQRDPAAARCGLLDRYVATAHADRGGHDTISIALTRFIVDSSVDVNDLLDHAFVESRGLPGWIEDRADRFPVSNRTEGGTIQAGHWVGPDGRSRYLANKDVLYQRANVVYLLQTSATTASTSPTVQAGLQDIVVSAHLED